MRTRLPKSNCSSRIAAPGTPPHTWGAWRRRKDSTPLLQAREHRLKNEHAAAIGIYKSILATAPTSDEAKIALVELGNVYREKKDKAVLNYIESFTRQPNPFRAAALELLANRYTTDGNLTAASAVNALLMTDFAGTIHEKHGRMNQFFLQFNAKQYNSAREQLAQLTAKHPTDEAVLLAS